MYARRRSCCGCYLDPNKLRDNKKADPSAADTENGEADQKLNNPRSASILTNI